MEGEGRQKVTVEEVATSGPGTANPNGIPMVGGVVSQWDLTVSLFGGKFRGLRTMFCVPLMATFSTFPQKSSSHARWRNISNGIQPVAGTAEAGANPKVTVAGVEANLATGEEAGNRPSTATSPKGAGTAAVASSPAMVSHLKVGATAEA